MSEQNLKNVKFEGGQSILEGCRDAPQLALIYSRMRPSLDKSTSHQGAAEARVCVCACARVCFTGLLC